MISKEAFEKLISDKAPEIKAKAVVLFNGMVQGANAYQKDSTAANLRNWRAAEKELDEFLASIGEGATTERTFRSITAVVKYLYDQGYKISDRTGYNHKHKGLIRPRADGKYYLSDVMAYAGAGHIQKLDGTRPEDSDPDLERKRRAEAETAEYLARIHKVKAEALENRYIERFAFDKAISQRAALFKNDLETLARSKAPDMVSLVHGDTGHIPDLIEYLLSLFEQCLGRYAENREFIVPAQHTVTESVEESRSDQDDE